MEHFGEEPFIEPLQVTDVVMFLVQQHDLRVLNFFRNTFFCIFAAHWLNLNHFHLYDEWLNKHKPVSVFCLQFKNYAKQQLRKKKD